MAVHIDKMINGGGLIRPDFRAYFAATAYRGFYDNCISENCRAPARNERAVARLGVHAAAFATRT
jgi:hypothetical protein